ncbi:MAG: hypothetical protein QW503_06535 [Sulfolobales archaeon]
MVEVTKYVAKALHPLAPFTIRVEASSIESALEQLQLYLDIIMKQTKKEMEKKEEEAKKEVKEEKKVANVGRNPLTCIRARRLVQMSGGKVNMVKYTCPKYLLEEREDFKPSEDFDQCAKCDQYVFTDLRLR